MKAHHEGLGDDQAAFLLGSLDLTGLIGVERDRLLAQHMLAGFKRLDGQRGMEMVRKGIVDRVDIWIGQQSLVRSIGPRDAEIHSGRLGPPLIA